MNDDKKPEIASLSLGDIDVHELEARIEMAANAAACSCQASCDNNCGGNAACKPA